MADCVGADREKLFYNGKFDDIDVPQKHLERLKIIKEKLLEIQNSIDVQSKHNLLDLNILYI
jgi:hypothetical protein